MGVLGKGETQMGRKWMEKVVVKELFHSLVQKLFCSVVKIPSRTFLGFIDNLLDVPLQSSCDIS